MYVFKKFKEGLAIIDDETGESRLLQQFEAERAKGEFKTLEDSKTASFSVDFLPAALKQLAVFPDKKKGKQR